MGSPATRRAAATLMLASLAVSCRGSGTPDERCPAPRGAIVELRRVAVEPVGGAAPGAEEATRAVWGEQIRMSAAGEIGFGGGVTLRAAMEVAP